MSAKRRVAGAVVGALAAAAVLLPAAPAMACTCLSRDRTALIAAADVVFVGRAVALRADPGAEVPTVRGTFDVASVYKGTAGRRVVVRTAADPASCGASFSTGSRYAVFAARDAAALVTDVCRGTTQDLSVLDGLTPIASTNEPTPDPVGDSRAGPILFAVLLAGAVAVARGMWVRRRPRPLL